MSETYAHLSPRLLLGDMTICVNNLMIVIGAVLFQVGTLSFTYPKGVAPTVL